MSKILKAFTPLLIIMLVLATSNAINVFAEKAALESEEILLKDVRLRYGNPVIDSEGNFIAKGDEHHLEMFSKSGELIRKIGRPGEGPGDIKRLSWFAVEPISNNIYITEFFGGNRRISIFDKTGDYAGHLVPGLDFDIWGALSGIDFDSKGNLYVQASRVKAIQKQNYRISQMENSIFRFDSNGKNKMKVYSMVYNQSVDTHIGNFTIPFNNYLYWAVCNNMLIVREHSDKYLQVLDLGGKIIKNIDLPFEAEKVTEEDIESWLNTMKRWRADLDLNMLRDLVPIPEYKPISGYMIVSDGKYTVLSQRYDRNEYAVIDLKKYKVTKVIETEHRIISLTDDKIYFIRTDDLGNDIIMIESRSKYGL